MKNIIILFLIALTISCSSNLELAPEDQLTADLAFSSEELALGVLTGAYGSAQSIYVLNGAFQLMGEWQADNVDFSGSFPSFNEIKLYSTLSSNESVRVIWGDCYRTIGTVNLVIENVPLVDDVDFTQAERDNAVSQAKFLRALIYLNMANWWSQPIQVSGGNDLSVPLVLQPFDDVVEYPSRVSLNAVYAQIEQDLLEAIPHLGTADRSRATQGAAQALLARLYLIQERWNEAVNFADQVIQNSAFGLASDYSFYDTLSPELVFALVNTEADGQSGTEGFTGLANPAGQGRGDTPFSDNLLAAFADEPDDLRFSMLNQVGNDALGNLRTFTNKFSNGNAFVASDDAPVIRITEMYLTRAEANHRNGSTIGDTPINDINILRARAGLADLVTLSLDEILVERRKELCFEGFRRMDLLRNNMNLRRPGMPNEADSAPGQNKVIFPIPVNELDINSNLVQNPGY